MKRLATGVAAAFLTTNTPTNQLTTTANIAANLGSSNG